MQTVSPTDANQRLAAAAFQGFCDRVATQAKARGMTASVLRSLLKD